MCAFYLLCPRCTVNLEHSGNVRLATQVQVIWMPYHWSLWCSPDSSDLMFRRAWAQKHTQFCAETWKCSIALLRQEECYRKQAKGRQIQSYTRTGRRNKNLMLCSVLSKRTARASEEIISITEFCLWTKVWTVFKPGYSWLQRGILSHWHAGKAQFIEHEGFVLAVWMCSGKFNCKYSMVVTTWRIYWHW